MTVIRARCYLLLGVMFLLACSSCSPAPLPPKTLIYGRGEDANTLDPINTDIGEAVKVIVNIFDTLVTYDDETADLVPSLATSWETSEDGRTWTFQLREGVQFQDGTPFNAAAVQFSFERLLQPDHPQVFDKARPYRPNFQNIQSVRAEGEHTVVFELAQPSAVFLQNITMFPASIVSPTAVRERGADFAANPCGTGPFQLEQWDRDQKLVLSANKSHWRGLPGVDHVIFIPSRETTTRIEQLKRGEIHIADNLSGFDVEPLADQSDLDVQSQIGMNVAYLTMQTEKPPLDLPQVRQAIWLAIDKKELCQVAYASMADPAVSVVPQAMWGHADFADRPFDVEQARNLLVEVAKENKLKLPLQMTLGMMTQPRPYMQRPSAVGGFIKDSLEKIGIQVTLEPRDVNQHFDHVMAGKHQLALAGWSSDNNDPDNFLYSLLDPDNISEHGNNLSRYRNESFHQLLLQGQQELDQAKRLEIYLQAQRIAFDDAPVVPLVHVRTSIAQSKRLQGYKLHPTGMVRLRLATLEASP